ncbi:MAG TPA: biotin--[acetyl-CoA-carboxylase] ligase [Mycobacterium sp.]|nr:biotin--[acetyl-CoA-carboxylase] ligase [Mycobacterium sp.]
MRDPLRAPLDAESLRAMALKPPWHRLDIVTETGSTNADLVSRAMAGEDIDGAVLIAEHQTRGRGRNGRGWSAIPRAQVLLSVGVATREVPAQLWGWLPLAAGVAVADAVSAVSGVDASLKWPNDVLVDGGKLAGILAEAVPSQAIVVVGIGVNVSLRSAEVPDAEIASLLELGVEAPDRERLTARLLLDLGVRVAQWRQTDMGSNLKADYRARSATIGSRVRATLPGGEHVVGLARDVDDHGRLVIEADGQPVAISAGDVVHLRPADGSPDPKGA